MHTAIDAMHGALVVSCLFAAIFFLKFWAASRDRFFLWFSAAMVLLAANWVGVLWGNVVSEARHSVYVIRLAAFLLLIVGIADKNRRP